MGTECFGSSLPMPVVNSSVLQGTPLRSVWESLPRQSPNEMWFKEHTGSVLRQFLRRKRMVSKLISMGNADVQCNEREKTQDLDPEKSTLTVESSLSPPPRPLRLKKGRYSCPKASPFSSTPISNGSTELTIAHSKEALQHSNITPKRTIMQEMAVTCELLKTWKATINEHYRNKSQMSATCQRVERDREDLPRLKQRRVLSQIKPSQEQMETIHALLNHEFASLILASNGTFPHPASVYKCFIGPGNNSQLVLQILRKRWYWTKVDDWAQADFIWTQNRQREIIVSLPRLSRETLLIRTALKQLKPVTTKRTTKLIMEQERGKTGIKLISASQAYVPITPIEQTKPFRVYNRLERNFQLTSKKYLYHNLKSYCEQQKKDLFHYIPLTFHICPGSKEDEMGEFKAAYQRELGRKQREETANMWIIKPGEGTNCGRGIHVSSDLSDILGLVSGRHSSANRTYIIQRYIEAPLLINTRKFDIRCYGLLTAFNTHIQGYFYHDGYLRTSSREFSLSSSSRFIHLTNDAVQKKAEDYGKYEAGNKLSYEELGRYVQVQSDGKVEFERDIWPQMREMVLATFEATYSKLSPRRPLHTFEILGYDFMIDASFKVWLIEVNTNPCLALSSALLARLIPNMLDNAFKIVLDGHFPEPEGRRKQESKGKEVKNGFELLFSSLQCDKTGEIDENIQESEADIEGNQFDM